ncbi:MAG: DNA double-strand break repair nuclease NurA [Pyrinomonadaceae bacterium]
MASATSDGRKLFDSMIYRELLKKELDAKLGEFEDFRRLRDERVEACIEVLRRLVEFGPGSFGNASYPGAIPSAEVTECAGFAVRGGFEWQNHAEAREWASSVLNSRTTFAADGSQIYLGKEMDLPVGAIQVGWFENPHDASKSYVKQARFEILGPNDLLIPSDENLNPEARVGARRFHAEVEVVREFLFAKKGWRERGERMPVAFFDGTLLISFALPHTKLQQEFAQTMAKLVKDSEVAGVPLVGFVDRSLSRDLIALISHVEPQIVTDGIYDSMLFPVSGAEKPNEFLGWGDRSAFCFSKRKGLEVFVPDGEPSVGFVYLATGSKGLPARIDIPAWIFSEEMLDDLIEVVLAESVVGLGYPYALETADATALISFEDRRVFIEALAGMEAGFEAAAGFGRKEISKARRR